MDNYCLIFSYRYIEGDGLVNKDFLKLVECAAGTSGFAIGDHIMQSCMPVGFDFLKYMGHGLDGTGNMAGKTISAASVIQHQYTKETNVHCAANRTHCKSQ